MTTRIDNKPSLRHDPDFLIPAWTVSLYGIDCGTVLRTTEGWDAQRGIGGDAKRLGVFSTKLSAMHAVLGRGVKP
jgi:hypothetical protein